MLSRPALEEFKRRVAKRLTEQSRRKPADTTRIASLEAQVANLNQCSGHHDGGQHACPVALSVPRERVERVIFGWIDQELLNTDKLATIEARFASSTQGHVNHRPRIAHLEREIANYVTAIAAGGEIPELVAALKTARAEMERLKATEGLQAPRRRPAEPMARRIERMRTRLANGGEIAQAALISLFPESIRLRPDSSGEFLWATGAAHLDPLLGIEDWPLLGGWRRVGRHRFLSGPIGKFDPAATIAALKCEGSTGTHRRRALQRDDRLFELSRRKW